jgi:hypothetical protein
MREASHSSEIGNRRITPAGLPGYTPILSPRSASEATPAQAEITAPGNCQTAEDISGSLAEYPETPAVAATTQTAVGRVFCVTPPHKLETYGPEDLANLLAATPPQNLPRPHKQHDIAYVPGRSDVVLRWNRIRNAGAIAGVHDVVEHLKVYESQIKRLHDSGIRLLRRSVFVVEADEHHSGDPAVYMAVERLPHGQTLRDTSRQDPAARDAHFSVCQSLARYFIETVPDTFFLFESITHPGQYAANSALFDYDPHIARSDYMRMTELRAVGTWASYLPENRATRQLNDTINHHVALLENRIADSV